MMLAEKDGRDKAKTQERRESTKVFLNAMIKLNFQCLKILNYTGIPSYPSENASHEEDKQLGDKGVNRSLTVLGGMQRSSALWKSEQRISQK